MKFQLAALFISIYTSAFAQTYTDIAATQNIQDIQHSANHWANGTTFYDFDNDGWDDLVLPVENDSLIFYKNYNGTLTQIASYVFAGGSVRQITWVDFDNDNNLDLVVTYHNKGIRLYRNDGQFNFSDQTASFGVTTDAFVAYGVSFGDMDNDGDLDFYVCSYETVQVNGPLAYHNLFYRNNNNVSFTEEAGVLNIDNGAQPTFMSVWLDFDNDGDLDLHVINDREYAGDAFYVNNNGVFTDLSLALGIQNYGHNPMSISVSDYDNDSDLDIFVSDVANGTIVGGLPVDHKLFKNQNGTAFTNVAQSAGIDTSFYSWGGLWVDYDNDCFEDLYIATSFTDTQPVNERPSVFYHNNAGIDFTNFNDSLIGDIICSSYCPVKGDINNDGFYDIVVLNDGAPPNVFINAGNSNNYIKITPVGTISNNNAIGSFIEVYANGQHQTQQVFCGEGICAQNSQHKIFGIGPANTIDSIIVTFPSGIVMTEYNLSANQSIDIREKVTLYVDLNPSGNPIIACPDDTVQLTFSGYYNYEWSNGTNDSTILINNAGWYSFTAESITGDTIYVSNEVQVIYETLPLYQEIISNPICGITNSGSFLLLFNQPNLIDSVAWSNNFIGTFNDSLNAGAYTYEITTINGCVYIDSNQISEAPIFNTSIFTEPETDSTLGSVTFFIWGGIPPFTFILNSDTVSNPLSNLNAGDYSVVISDVNGCTDTIVFEINNTSIASITTILPADPVVYFNNDKVIVKNVFDFDIVYIIDANGKQRLINKVDLSYTANGFEFNSSLPSGYYLVHILGQANALVLPLVVIKN